MKLSPHLLEVLKEIGFERLTPIQAQCIPLLLEGRDLIGQSKTGSGKTAAFALPILEKLGAKPQLKKLQTLVLCPTRELCTQVAREFRRLGRRSPGLRVLILAGGTPIFDQLKALKHGAPIAVGTPGRILDHLKRGSLDLHQVSTLVLDEADRMLDMGFQEDLKRILEKVPRERQTVFFSATFPQSIEAMSRAYQRHPQRVTVEDEKVSAPAILQQAYAVEPDDKVQALLGLLGQHAPEMALIFCNLKTTVANLAEALARAKVSSACIHGDLEQHERDRIMAKFRNHSTRVLIASDVAARGLDIENLDLVVNFDLPAKPDVYVHRIGRTGRAGKKGLAISLCAPREISKLEAIEAATGFTIERKAAAKSARARETAKPSAAQEAKMETLHICGGRKDKLRPGDILGALTGEAGGLKASEIGKIEIFDRYSYVAVSRQVAKVALERLNQGRIKGHKFRVHWVR
ncbi:MAG: ATP-dependent RNA helicase DbpA [Deltaproteobacteria bacterium]|nr:ATP-dependent RNA helicase DbpA [Deltaproteobacteria bacterium]